MRKYKVSIDFVAFGELDDDVTKKLEAFMQHKTQAEMFARIKVVFEKTGDEEKYLLAATRGLPSSPMETDMFAGIEE